MVTWLTSMLYLFVCVYADLCTVKATILGIMEQWSDTVVAPNHSTVLSKYDWASVNPVFRFRRIVAKRSVFYCFVNTHNDMDTIEYAIRFATKRLKVKTDFRVGVKFQKCTQCSQHKIALTTTKNNEFSFCFICLFRKFKENVNAAQQATLTRTKNTGHWVLKCQRSLVSDELHDVTGC